MDIKQLHQAFLHSTGVTTDSRQIAEGNIFFALKGDNFNGNLFAKDALNKGCSYVVIDQNVDEIDNSRCFRVKDTLITLQELAKFHRQQTSIPVIAITGTNGKTTTKELIATVLSTKFNLIYTAGNLNNHIGVPLTLLRISEKTEIAVIEMGANHPGEIALLSSIAQPSHGLITNIGKAHLEGFGGFQGVIKTKNELYENLIRSGGTIFTNADNEILRNLLLDKVVKKITYGTSSDCTFNGKYTGSQPYLSFEIHVNDHFLPVKTQLAGSYNFENALAAACIGSFFGVEPGKIKLAIENYTPSNNRSQLQTTAYNQVLKDYYNANPSSMSAAIENFSMLEHPRKVVILGDMLELGEDTHIEHKKILEIALKHNFKQIILVGPHFRSASEGSRSIQTFMDSNELKNYLRINKITDSLILLKGSRGIKLENIAEEI